MFVTTIELYCYYVKPFDNKASFILKTHNIVKNKIYINSDSIDIMSDEKNNDISRLNELLNSIKSNSSIETKSISNTSSEIQINRNISNDNNSSIETKSISNTSSEIQINRNISNDNNSAELMSSSEKIKNILRIKLT